jgi:hypothetical protein
MKNKDLMIFETPVRNYEGIFEKSQTCFVVTQKVL